MRNVKDFKKLSNSKKLKIDQLYENKYIYDNFKKIIFWENKYCFEIFFIINILLEFMEWAFQNNLA
jgi:hypothetical protein